MHFHMHWYRSANETGPVLAGNVADFSRRWLPAFAYSK
jgi:membrane glycosyltransferase